LVAGAEAQVTGLGERSPEKTFAVVRGRATASGMDAELQSNAGQKSVQAGQVRIAHVVPEENHRGR